MPNFQVDYIKHYYYTKQVNLQKLLNTMIQRRKNIKNFKQICLRRGRFIQQGINTHIEDVKKR